MLRAHPAILRGLVDHYGEVLALHTGQGTCATRRQLEDATYTLCVSTGTRTAEAALIVAEEQLAAALCEGTRGDIGLTA
ncbi:DUF5133 domain-containing protein [Streptomyces sp. NBC_00859]|uniref:DUF5133 domain-containing protein n=1 Tax=Streptomyces sp. NBC_00859 TaxID=2903682 RepID=UPI003870BAEA|nr:DUF5133 domain-containing protein [Streptomyces sp. NBC_00859]